MANKVLRDIEFGEIYVRTNVRMRHISLSVENDASLRVSAPHHAAMRDIQALIDSSRDKIRKMQQSSQQRMRVYLPGDLVGKSHSIVVNQSDTLRATINGQHITLYLPASADPSEPAVQKTLRPAVAKALRQEASHYLARRLARLAELHHYSYERIRFTNAKTRWGSCSSNGTISLNIALMLLPFELIDYVLIHELCHTVHMNHSSDFWSAVKRVDAEYLSHKSTLKLYSPAI